MDASKWIPPDGISGVFIRSRRTVVDGWTKWEFGNFSPNIFDNWFVHSVAHLASRVRKTTTEEEPGLHLLHVIIVFKKRERVSEWGIVIVRSAHVLAAAIITACFYVFILIRTSTSMMYYYYHRSRRRRRRLRCVFTRCFHNFFSLPRHSNPQMNYLFESFSSISDEEQCVWVCATQAVWDIRQCRLLRTTYPVSNDPHSANDEILIEKKLQ